MNRSSDRIWLLCCLVGILSPGCVSRPAGQGGPAGSSRKSIDQIHLLLTSVALNFDKIPGPDGFGVRVYAASHLSPAPLPIVTGTLEILMFDGPIATADIRSATPLHLWKHTALELANYFQKTSVGPSYRFTVIWGHDQPTRERITVVARYLSTDGRQIYSSPGTIPLAVK